MIFTRSVVLLVVSGVLFFSSPLAMTQTLPWSRNPIGPKPATPPSQIQALNGLVEPLVTSSVAGNVSTCSLPESTCISSSGCKGPFQDDARALTSEPVGTLKSPYSTKKNRLYLRDVCLDRFSYTRIIEPPPVGTRYGCSVSVTIKKPMVYSVNVKSEDFVACNMLHTAILAEATITNMIVDYLNDTTFVVTEYKNAPPGNEGHLVQPTDGPWGEPSSNLVSFSLDRPRGLAIK